MKPTTERQVRCAVFGEIPESRVTEKVCRWIRFELAQTCPRTCIWTVYTNDGGCLGEVKWWSGWRKYCFFPASGSLYEQDCLRDIANFCQEVTTIHREPVSAAVEVDAPF